MNRTPLRLATVVAILLGVAPIGRAQDADAPYRILITNDDGIDSPGITALVDVLGEWAEVVVVAPAGNRSGSSHATESLSAPTRVTPFRRDGEIVGHAVEGTPADAARFGLFELGKEDPFDLVVSGINRGENVGLVAHMSGTVGAAKEAIFHGVPAIAVSQSGRRGEDFHTTARIAAQVARQVRERGLAPGVMLSINVPPGELSGVIPTRMAGSFLRFDGYVATGTEGDTTSYRLRLALQVPKEGGDTRSFLNGYATVTPIRLDMTDYDTLGEIAGWTLDGPIDGSG